MFLAVKCQHVSSTCQSHSRPVLSLREALRKYAELSHSTLPFLRLHFHEKDLSPTPRLLQVRLIFPPLGHILSEDLKLGDMREVEGIKSGLDIKGMGTFKFKIKDDNSMTHKIEIPNSLYVPG